MQRKAAPSTSEQLQAADAEVVRLRAKLKQESVSAAQIAPKAQVDKAA
jgi:hypothetical protein